MYLTVMYNVRGQRARGKKNGKGERRDFKEFGIFGTNKTNHVINRGAEVTLLWGGPQAEVRLYRLFVANKLVLASFVRIFDNNYFRKSWLRYFFF